MAWKTLILTIIGKTIVPHHNQLTRLSMTISTAMCLFHQTKMAIWITKFKSHIVEINIKNRKRMSNRIQGLYQSTEQQTKKSLEFKIKCNRKGEAIRKIKITRTSNLHRIKCMWTMIKEMKALQKWIYWVVKILKEKIQFLDFR